MSNFRKHVNAVRKFMEKQEFPIDLDIIKCELTMNEISCLNIAASSLYKKASYLERFNETHPNCSSTIARAQLMIEELAETLEAMITGNEVELLDGLADLLFVTFGTAITYNMPIEEAHEAVCKSNMSKAKRNKATNTRIRFKGENYEPPKIKEILERHHNDRRS